MNFKDYYSALSTGDKKTLRDMLVPKYMQYPTFYQKMTEGKFTELEFEKLEEITGQTFER